MGEVQHYAMAVVESKLKETRISADFYGRNGRELDWSIMELQLVAAHSMNEAFYRNGQLQLGEYQALKAEIERMANNYDVTIL